MGYPGTQLTRTSIKQNEFNWGIHFWTLSTLQRVFNPDGIFFFMDLAVEANALGLPVRYPLHESPTVEHHLVEKLEDLNQFMAADPLKDGRLEAFVETMRLMKRGFPEDLLKCAYVTGPYTLAALMIGASEIAVRTITEEAFVLGVLETATFTALRYARALFEAGADCIAVLEPTAVMLSPEAFRRFSARFIGRMVSELEGPLVLHICGNSTHLIEGMCETGVEGVSLDSDVDPVEIMPKLPEETVFLGNIDPVTVMRGSTPTQISTAVTDLLEAVRNYRNFILSTGCDLPVDTPQENIHAFIRAGKRMKVKGG